MKATKIIKTETVFSIPGRYSVVSADVEVPNGVKATWTYFAMKNAAVIVPIDADGSTYLKYEWRLARNDFAWEFASGWVDEAQNNVVDEVAICAAANRELQEEIGLTAESLKLVQSFYITNHANSIFSIVLAEGLSESKLDGDVDEYVEVRKVSLTEARGLLVEEQIPTGQTLVALQEYEKRLQELQK